MDDIDAFISETQGHGGDVDAVLTAARERTLYGALEGMNVAEALGLLAAVVANICVKHADGENQKGLAQTFSRIVDDIIEKARR